ncbi:hypothetical protein DIPPA_22873 [Diplonema papillatum]|nr:hypothetical protein DIPPA_22873 [Diplonema papillatum]
MSSSPGAPSVGMLSVRQSDQCPMTGMHYVDVGNAPELQQFREVKAFVVRFVDQVSSTSSRMRRVLVLTYKRLIIVDVKKSSIIKRWHTTARISSVVGKEYSIGKREYSQVLVTNTDDLDLLIEFPDDKRNPMRPDGQVCTAKVFMSIVDRIRRQQRSNEESTVKWLGMMQAAPTDILEQRAQLSKGKMPSYQSPEKRVHKAIVRGYSPSRAGSVWTGTESPREIHHHQPHDAGGYRNGAAGMNSARSGTGSPGMPATKRASGAGTPPSPLPPQHDSPPPPAAAAARGRAGNESVVSFADERVAQRSGQSSPAQPPQQPPPSGPDVPTMLEAERYAIRKTGRVPSAVADINPKVYAEAPSPAGPSPNWTLPDLSALPRNPFAGECFEEVHDIQRATGLLPGFSPADMVCRRPGCHSSNLHTDPAGYAHCVSCSQHRGLCCSRCFNEFQQAIPQPETAALSFPNSPPSPPPRTWCYYEQVNPDPEKRKHTYYVYKKRLIALEADGDEIWFTASSRREFEESDPDSATSAASLRVHLDHVVKVGEEHPVALSLEKLKIAFFIRTSSTKLVFLPPTTIERDTWIHWFTYHLPHTRVISGSPAGQSAAS